MSSQSLKYLAGIRAIGRATLDRLNWTGNVRRTRNVTWSVSADDGRHRARCTATALDRTRFILGTLYVKSITRCIPGTLDGARKVGRARGGEPRRAVTPARPAGNLARSIRTSVRTTAWACGRRAAA